MTDRILVLYGSYRSDHMDIRLAEYGVAALNAGGNGVALIGAKSIGLPMLGRMYKEYAPGTAPAPLQSLAEKIIAADAFVFVAGEYNSGPQPGRRRKPPC